MKKGENNRKQRKRTGSKKMKNNRRVADANEEQAANINLNRLVTRVRVASGCACQSLLFISGTEGNRMRGGSREGHDYIACEAKDIACSSKKKKNKTRARE